MKTGKTKITKEQLYKIMRKSSRERELETFGGWYAKKKVHRSKKAYKRRAKHRSKNI